MNAGWYFTHFKMWRCICAKTLNKIGYVQLTINSETKISKLESNIQNCQPSHSRCISRHICHSLTWFLSKCPQLREHKIYWHFNLRLHCYRFKYSTYSVLAIWKWRGWVLHSHDKKTQTQQRVWPDHWPLSQYISNWYKHTLAFRFAHWHSKCRFSFEVRF